MLPSLRHIASVARRASVSAVGAPAAHVAVERVPQAIFSRYQHTASTGAGDASSAAPPPPLRGHAVPLKTHNNPATLMRTPQIVPKWWPGHNAVDPTLFTIDCSDLNLPAIAEDLATRGVDAVPADLKKNMEQLFEDQGMVLLTNSGLGDHMQAMRSIVDVIICGGMAYEGGSNSRREIDANVFDTGAPKEAHLHYHHEMAYVGQSTTMVAFCCDETPGDGTGATFASQAVGTTDMLLKTELGQKLKDKGISYIRCLTDAATGLDDAVDNDESPVYNHWQQSFHADTPEEVEKLAKAKGLEIEWGPNRFLKTRFTVSAYEYFEPLQRNLLYAAVADDSMWFDTWPGVRHLPTMESWDSCTAEDRPLKITFGDGTDFTREELQTFVDVYDAYGVKLDWKRGDMAIMCNFRWAHGRPAFSLGPGQKRNLGVVLGDVFDRQGQDNSKW